MTEIPSLAKQRRLHIIDDVVPISNVDKRLVERLHFDKQGAERIIFGDEASYALGRWVRDCEDLFLSNIQFAAPPFPKTYLELTLWQFHRGLGRPVSGPEETADDRFGFLIVGKHVRTVVNSNMGRRHPHNGFFEYWMNTPESNRLMDGPLGREIAWRGGLLMGSSYHALDDRNLFVHILNGTRIRPMLYDDPNFRKYLEERVMVGNRVGTRLQSFIKDCAGEMRTLWAALLILNQHRQRIGSRNVPRETLITPRGRKIYLAHTLITIPMFPTPAETRKAFYPAMRTSPVGHRVIAHWRDYHKRAGCDHVWPLFPDEDGRYHCPKCPGYRVRIQSFHRGRTEIGYNLHTYEVSP